MGLNCINYVGASWCTLCTQCAHQVATEGEELRTHHTSAHLCWQSASRFLRTERHRGRTVGKGLERQIDTSVANTNVATSSHMESSVAQTTSHRRNKGNKRRSYGECCTKEALYRFLVGFASLWKSLLLQDSIQQGIGLCSLAYSSAAWINSSVQYLEIESFHLRCFENKNCSKRETGK